MIEIRKPKIGLAGVMAVPFRGDKEGNYHEDRNRLEGMASKLGFDFHAVDFGIYTSESAEAAAGELANWGADFVLLQTSSFASGDFIYPFAGLDTRLGIWAVPEGPPTSEGGLPLNSLTAANLYNSILRGVRADQPNQVKWFYGRPGQSLFDERLIITIRALRGLVNLPGKTVALIGGVAPSFDNLIIDEEMLYKRLGLRVLRIDIDTLLDIARGIDERKAVEAGREIRASATRYDPQYDKILVRSGRVYKAVTQLAEENDFDAVSLSCWPKLQSDYRLAACSVMGHLNSTGLIAACEGDVASAVSMLMLHYVTGGETVTLMDMVSIDEADNSVLLWHCGPTAPRLADEKGTTLQPLWLFNGEDGTQIGLHNDLVLRPDKCSVIGFTTSFDRMLILEGEVDNQKSSYIGSRGWVKNLTLNKAPIMVPELLETIMVSGFQHHYPFAFGHLADAGLELCAWLGIEPIDQIPYTHYLK